MNHAEVAKLEDAASAALAIRGDWERAYRRSRSQHNWRELAIADACASRWMRELNRARAQMKRDEQAKRAEARAAKQSRQLAFI